MVHGGWGEHFGMWEDAWELGLLNADYFLFSRSRDLGTQLLIKKGSKGIEIVD